MVGRRKKAKICDKGSHEEDCISKLPDHLISDILVHLPTKDAVKTSLLSTRWRNLWPLLPGLDLDSVAFSDVDALVSFAVKFFDSHKDSWIRTLRLRHDPNCTASLTQWINAITMRTIQHLDVGHRTSCQPDVFPLSIYTCQTLVHLRLCWVSLANVDIVSLPCLKILHLDCITHLYEATMEKFISGSPVLEDLTIVSNLTANRKAIQVRSHTLKRIHIDHSIEVVIDAPLLQCLRTEFYSTKNFKIISLGFSTKLIIDDAVTYRQSLIHDILSDVSRFKDLVMRNVSWKQIFLYSNSGPVLQFRHLSRLNATLFKSNLEKLPTILESCPKLESLILELVKEPSTRHKKKGEPKVIFSSVPECLVSSLKFVELKRSISAYEGETELIRYILKNSRILEKLRLDNSYDTKKAKCAFLTELMTMPRWSNACQVFVL